MRRPTFERWGIAVVTCNYRPFKRVTGEKERSRMTLPCGRSVCTSCKAVCIHKPVFSHAQFQPA